jgi:hypothetical protein
MYPPRFILTARAFVAAFILIGCSQPKHQTRPSAPPSAGQVTNDDPPSVLFDIRAIPSSRETPGETYDCSFSARQKVAHFRLQLAYGNSSTDSQEFSFGSGSFISAADSDNAALLDDLKTALEAKTIPAKPGRRAELQFNLAVLGRNETRDPSGGFSRQPKGDWILLKLFFPPGGDDAEVYLNLNPKSGKAEFSLKDPDYGDYLLQHFAEVL